MNDLVGEFANLSAEERELLALLLQEDGVKFSDLGVLPRDRTLDPPPLSYAQQRLWFLDQLEPGSAMYNMPAAARLTGQLNFACLQRAVDEIIARHEVLRTAFAPSANGEPVQVIAEQAHLPIAVADLTGLAAEAQAQEIARLARDEVERPFDLAAGPLLRMTLAVLSDCEHVLLLNMHHIVTDGWSIGVFLKELAALYTAAVTGAPSPLPPLAVQYADYAAWQREHLRGERLDEQLTFWRATLGGAAPVIELPFDRPRPPVQTYNGAAAEFLVPPNVRDALNALAQAESATLFMALLAAFQTLLARYSHQTDISIGTPIANRTRRELEDLIGFFANTLVIRGDLSGSPTYRELLQCTRERTLAAFEHQDVPFERVVEAVQPERTLSYAPLFQVLFVLQNVPQQPRQLPGIVLNPVQFPSITSKFDLTLNMTERPDGISGSIEYNTDLFDAATMDRLIGHFQRLLAAIVAEPDGRVDQIPLLSPAERHRLLEEWNATATAADLEQCIHWLFEAQAERTPAAIALAFEQQRLTYAELDCRANQLAHHLQRLGVGPEVLVGVCMQRTPEMVIALLAVWKAGGAYIPLDPRYPAERLAYMAEDAGIGVIISQSALADVLPTHRATSVYVDRDAGVIACQPMTRPAATVTPSNLSYVLFTSGSTGRPKGVAIQHRSVTAMIRWAQRVYAPAQLAGVLASTSISFDISVYELFATLSSGGRAVLVENALSLPALDADAGVTLINTVPSAGAELVRLDAIPPSVHTVNLAGEPLSQQLVERLYALPTVEHVYDLYGPTEDTTYSTWARREPGGSATIGRPLDNSQVYLLDEHLNLVPQGVVGEIYIGGAGLARGYLHRPDLTAERFVPNPFAAVPDARMYRTGDLARYRPDGSLQYLRRRDYQVKLRGFRIELGEVEATLRTHPAIKEAVVLVREDQPGHPRLVAYLVPHNVAPVIADVRAHLLAHLPDYMVPAAYVLLTALPLTPNAKVDRRALPPPEAATIDDEAAYVAPRSPTEETLAAIWAGLLGVKRVGVHDNFFALGGHSLLATQLVSRVREAFDIELPLRSLFETPTVAGLAATVELHRQKAAGMMLPQMVPTPRVAEDGEPVGLRLSFAQQRLWFLDQLEPDSILYNIPAAVRLQGQLNVQALEQAVNTIIARHEVLRTTFAAVDGVAVQKIAPQLTVSIPVMDLTATAGLDIEQEVRRLADREARTPFNLATGPVLRTTLIKTAADEHVLLLTMHHIASDGWSISVMLREIAALYPAFSEEETAPAAGASIAELVPALPVQYADYAAWQRGWLQGAVLEAQLDYWRERLRGASPLLDLPTDRQRPAVQSYHGTNEVFALPRDLAEALTELGQREGATHFMTLLAAFQVLLYRYSRQTDICVGTPIANRTRAEIENLIGFFVNTLVIRTDLGGRPTFRDLLKRVRESALGAYAHQDVPFETVVDAVQPQRNLSYSPLFQVMFVLQNASRDTFRLPALELESIPVHSGTTPFDLTLVLAETPAGLNASFEYNPDLFDAATIRGMATAFHMLLTEIVAHPDQPISRLNILSPEERETVLVTWNQTAHPYPAEKCIHQLFEAQAAATPDATAIRFVTEVQAGAVKPVAPPVELTYFELNARADRLAHQLIALGVRPEQMVGISIERSPELIIAMLGILKAGAAFVPLDPAYPADRITYMLEDSGAAVLVTQERLLTQLKIDDQRLKIVSLDEPLSAEQTGASIFDLQSIMVSCDNLAYSIYTSGSTGRPKGTLLAHRGLVSFINAYIRIFELGPGDRVLLFSSPNFDASLAEIFGALLSGATLTLAPRDLLLSATTLPALLAEQAIKYTLLPPAMVAALPVTDLPDLQMLEIGGDALHADVARRWIRGRRLFNGYGPTEATIGPTLYEITDLTRERAIVSIGRPVDNMRTYILDAEMQPVPIGVAGELCITGVGLARGYHGRPDLTAERFLPDPFTTDDGRRTTDTGRASSVSGPPSSVRMYRTGDLVRYRRDGNIEFLGRIDQQVKIRGFRIELGEIEEVLRTHSAVRDAAVTARDDGASGKRLVGYVVPRDGETPSTPDLRRFLLAKLPDYMVPAAFVTLASLPINPSGKVDRNALPAPTETGETDTGTTFAAPTTPVEQILADIWTQVLGVTRTGRAAGISVHDNFFDLGGDSILSIQVIARANQAGLRLTPKQLFQAPTIAALAALAESAGGPTVQAEQGPVEGPVTLTPIQRRFFELDLADRNHWNQSILLGVRERLEAASLRAAVAALVAHHDALRVRYTRGEQGWQAYNAAPQDDVPFACVDLSGLDDAAAAAAVEAHATNTQKTLDIERGPLFRVAYYDFGPQRAGRLLLVGHHLAVDGVSWRILLEDLQAGYAQHQRSAAIQLPSKTTSFRAWTLALDSYAQSEAVRAELDTWLAQGESWTPPLPTDLPGGPEDNTEASAEQVSMTLTLDETQALLTEVPPVYGTEINDILLTALTQAVGTWTGTAILAVHLEGHGREEISEVVDVSRTVGWFTSLYPVRLELPYGAGPGEAIKAVKEQLRSVPNHGIGYGLLRYLHPEPDVRGLLAGLPEPQMTFNYLGQFDQALSEDSPLTAARESAGPDRAPAGPRTHLLDVTGGIAGGRLNLACTYSRNLHERATVERFAAALADALRNLIAHCRSPEAGGYTPSDFPLAELDQKQLDKLLKKVKTR